MQQELCCCDHSGDQTRFLSETLIIKLKSLVGWTEMTKLWFLRAVLVEWLIVSICDGSILLSKRNRCKLVNVSMLINW